MAVAFEGGVVIGADSRTTTGSYIVSISLFSAFPFGRWAFKLLLIFGVSFAIPFPRSTVLVLSLRRNDVYPFHRQTE